MFDDSEEFEQDQMTKDELVEIAIGNETGEPVEFRVVAAHEPRFGERLRQLAAGEDLYDSLGLLADAIDQDARHQAVRLGAKRGVMKTDLRRQVAEAVERLRYAVEHHDSITLETHDVLDAKTFLTELERIFGERPASQQGADFDRVISAYLEWSLQTFPNSTPASVAAHLRKEVWELNERPESAEELVDIVALAFHSAARQGYDLTAELEKKLAVLKMRTWQAPDADGVVEHVRDSAPSAEVIDLMEALKASLAQHPNAHNRREREAERFADSDGADR